MKKNVGRTDQIIRIILGIILVAVGILVPMDVTATMTWFQIILIVIGAFLLLTGFLSYCPLYALLKINTLGK